MDPEESVVRGEIWTGAQRLRGNSARKGNEREEL